MDERGLFTMALGLTPPWEVVDIDFDAERHRLDLYLDFPAGSRFACPQCEVACGVHDTNERSWRHLNFFQHEAYLHARLPRIKCPEHGVKTVEVPWARPGAGFTLLFEALVLLMARKGMTPKGIGEILGEHDTRIWRVLEYYVDSSLAKQDWSEVEAVGVDETSRSRGHDYVTVFVDMDEAKVLHVEPGKDHRTVAGFEAELHAHGGKPEQVKEFSMDMSAAFIKGVGKQFPDAAMTFDRFHVMKLVNKAVDEVRREERQDRTELEKTRWVWLKNEQNLTDKEREKFDELKDSTLKTARGYRLKETLQSVYADYAGHPDDGEKQLQYWYFWATHSQLPPMIKVAKTIKTHWDGVLRWFQSGLTQGLVEGINGIIQAAKRKARGFRSFRKLRTMIFLVAGKLDFDLPQMKLLTHSK